MDTAKNFAKGVLSTGYNSAATSVVLLSGQGVRFPSTVFNAVWWNATDYPDPSDDPNVEVVRVTARSTDTLTIVRAQEGTAAANHNTAGKLHKLLAGLTAATVNEIGDSFVGLYKLNGGMDCSTNPDYPASEAGFSYNVTVSGLIGGTAGVPVIVGDTILTLATNAGGSQATVGSSWNILAGGARIYTAILDADFSITANSGFADVTGFSVALPVGVYQVEWRAYMYGASSVPGLKLGYVTDQAISTYTVDINGPQNNIFGGNVDIQTSTTGYRQVVGMTGCFISSGTWILTASTAVKFQIGQITSSADSITIKKGAHFIARRIA